MIIRETDTGNWLGWSGSTWVPLAGGGGGGGGGYVPVKGEWRATTDQSIPNNTNTPLAYGTEVIASAVVTRNTFGVGHSFTLGEDGCYAISGIGRFAAGAAGTRFVGLYNTADTTTWAADSNDGGPGASLPYVGC